MSKLKLEVYGLTYSQAQSGAYALILGELDGLRRIPIIIGQSEAQAIAIQLQGLEAPRPLTHDLIQTLMKSYAISLREVYIYKFEKDIFFSELICWRDGEEVKRIDARTSDAIALAVRANCPIFIDENIMNSAGIIFETETPTEAEIPVEEKKDTLEMATITELEAMLQDSISVENYELASKIRDEIKRRE